MMSSVQLSTACHNRTQCQTNGNHDETAATRAAPSVASLGIFRGGGM